MAGKVDLANILHPVVDPTYDQCFVRDSKMSCMEHLKMEQDLDNYVVCECQDIVNSTDSRLVCQRRHCLHCNEENTICGFAAYGSIFDGEFGRVTQKFEGFQFSEGRTDLVAVHTHNDIKLANETCTMTLNDDACDACFPSECSTDNAQAKFHGVTFDCQNLHGGLFYDGCSEIALPGVFEFINSPSFQECIGTQSARESCEETLLKTMTSEHSLQKFCGCHSTDDGGYELICTDEDDCEFCSDSSGEVCADYSEHRVEINKFGAYVSHIDTFQYTKGRDELVVIRDNSIECQVTVKGEICGSCDYVDCPTSGEHSHRGLSIDCTNLLGENATYACGEGHEIFTSISESAYYMCASDTEAPTKSPTKAPSVPVTSSPTVESAASGFTVLLAIAFTGLTGLACIYSL